MRIAVIADTHDSLPAGLTGLLRGADEIWHLGDLTTQDVYFELASLGRPFVVVRGNCDADEQWPLEVTLERGGLRCHLVHIAPHLAPSDVHVVLHGHTHTPRDWTDPLGVRWLNPGSASKPRGGTPASLGWLEFDRRGIRSWDVQPLRR